MVPNRSPFRLFGRGCLRGLLFAGNRGSLWRVRLGSCPGEHPRRPAPAGEPLSEDFIVTADDANVPVYVAKIAPGDDELRSKAMDDIAHAGQYVERAALRPSIWTDLLRFVSLLREPLRSGIPPTSYHIVPDIHDNTLTFTLATPQNLTVEINGDWVHSLHLFASPMESDVPRSDDPNVMYFGPGIHEVSKGIHVTEGKTLYCRRRNPPRRRHGAGRSSCSRAIMSLCAAVGSSMARPARPYPQPAVVHGDDIAIDGVILRDSSTWNVPMRRCDRVTVTDLKILGSRPNSDGIDICNSRDVTVDGCFSRTLDDLIVVKADKGQGEVHRVLVRNCVLWNQVAHALSVGRELRENVDDVRFENCDVIHDTGRGWTLRVSIATRQP